MTRPMRRSGVSIRLVPAALIADAALNKMYLGSAIQQIIANPSSAPSQLQAVATNAVGNAGGILADVVAAILWTKIFPRTPGIRLGRFRVSF